MLRSFKSSDQASAGQLNESRFFQAWRRCGCCKQLALSVKIRINNVTLGASAMVDTYNIAMLYCVTVAA